MLAKLRRFVFALVGFALTTTIYLSLTPEMSFIKDLHTKYGYWGGIALGIVVGVIFFLLEPIASKQLKKISKKFDKELSVYSQVDIILGSVGLLLGFFIAFFVSKLLENLYIVGPVLSIISYIIFGLIGIRIGVRSKTSR